MRLITLVLSLFIMFLLGSIAFTQDIPQNIVSARLDGPPQFYGRGGDLWMSTWSDDGNLYITWGDGTGRSNCCAAYTLDIDMTCTPVDAGVSTEGIFFVAPDVCDANAYCTCPFTDFGVMDFHSSPMERENCEEDCIVSRHVPSGIPPFDLENPETGIPAERDDKPSSIISIGGVLYVAGHSPLAYPDFGYLAYSEDYGQTWVEVPDSPWTGDSPFKVLMFINMGQDYSLNTDGFVYALGMGTETNWSTEFGYEDSTIYLTRVPAPEILNYASYEYYIGMENGRPSWVHEQSLAVPLDNIQSQMQGSAIYHEGAGEYLFLTSNPGVLFAAPHPWGPWRQVAELLSDAALMDPNLRPAGWVGGGYIPGLITKDAGPDYVYFTISGVDGTTHYELTMGKIILELASGN